ncbi:MAG: PIN domain-containing protein [Thermoplasmata archaeon]
MVRSLNTSFLIDVLRGHRGAVAKAQLLDSESEAVAIPAPTPAEFLDGAYFTGRTYLAKAMQLIPGRDVVPLDKECSPIAGPLRADRNWTKRGPMSEPVRDRPTRAQR